MKLKFSALIEDARGKDGNLVIRDSRSGPVATPRVTPRNPRSTGQLKVRSAMDTSSKAFANMSPTQAAAWNAYGASITKTNPVNGRTYTSTGIAAFNALATKYLLANNGGAAPMTPPTSAFAGDSISVTATAGTGQITFTGSGANADNVTTELLLQPLKGKNRKPSAGGYRTQAYKEFTTGPNLSKVVSVGPGTYAAAYRFVNIQTGQETALTPIAVVTVALALEDGGIEEAPAATKKAA